MATITKIEVQKKHEDRVNIYLDDKFFMGVYKEIVYTLGIKKDQQIDEDKLKEMLNEEMYIKGKNKALNILSRNDQSQKIIKDKLLNEFDEDVVDKVIDFLKKYNFINDEILASKITNTNVKLNRYGKNKIKQNLYTKGIDKGIISEAVSKVDENTEFENAMHLAKKRYERIKNEDKSKVYRKIAQHLTYKGFEYDTVKKVLGKLLNYDEYEI
jgi:regulatory protein